MIFAYQSLLIAALLSAVTAALLSFSLIGTELTYLFFLPLFFGLFATIIGALTWRSGPSPFLAICFATAFLRYVAFPALAALNRGYEGRSWVPPTESSYQLAIFLMCYEIIFVSALLVILERRFHRRSRDAVDVQTTTLPLGYLLLLAAVAFVLLALFPQSLLLLSVGPSIFDVDEMVFPAMATFVGMTIIAVKVFLFIKVVRLVATSPRWRRIAPWLALSFGAVNVMVYFGTNRLAMVLTALTTIWLIRESFGSRASVPVIALVALSLVLFSALTEDREYVRISQKPLENIADNIQVYTGGVYNVAIGVEVREMFPEASEYSVLLFDFLRPMVGINLIAQHWDRQYSNIYFNLRMFTHIERRSQIMPMIAQGNLFFSAPFAPILSLLFVCLGYVLQQLIIKARYVELRYALFIVVVRLGFFWGQNSMNMINFLSLHLLIPLILVAPYLIWRMLGGERFSRVSQGQIVARV